MGGRGGKGRKERTLGIIIEVDTAEWTNVDWLEIGLGLGFDLSRSPLPSSHKLY